MPDDAPLIRLDGLSKAWAGIPALERVSLDIRAGEVHALCGENGAGKSTLIRILAGVHAADAGEVRIAGRPLVQGSVRAAEAAGIAVMHQESVAFPDQNAVENLFVGREITAWGGLALDRREMRRQARAIFDRLETAIDLDAPLRDLPLAQRQMTALARALLRQARLVIMDEPTASLSIRETQVLARVVRALAAGGTAVLYVSHRLEEIFALADRVTVLRDGRLVETVPTSRTDPASLIRAMVGRDVAAAERTEATADGGVALEVAGLARAGVFSDVSFTVHGGEIVGLAGLTGAGRSEIARSIFGLDPRDSGHVRLHGRPLPPRNVAAAIAGGLAFVPEDRQHEGLVLPMSVTDNLSLPMLRRLSAGGIVRRGRQRELVRSQMAGLSVRAAGPRIPAAKLSGGNQQKLVLGKWLATGPRVLLLDEPTRGVDAGARQLVHREIQQLAGQGMACLLISSDLPELLALSHRVLVLCEGRITGEVSGGEATPEAVLALMLPDGRRETDRGRERRGR